MANRLQELFRVLRDHSDVSDMEIVALSAALLTYSRGYDSETATKRYGIVPKSCATALAKDLVPSPWDKEGIEEYLKFYPEERGG